MRALIYSTLLLFACVLTPACGDESPSRGVDLETPVTGLAGWDSMVADLELPPERQAVLARWVETFRTGLDITRQETDRETSLEYEDRWWLDAERSLGALVGEEAVTHVISWLEAQFGRRGVGR